MTCRGNRITRGELGGKLDQRRRELTEKGEEIDRTVGDLETERHTRDALEAHGTLEGDQAVGRAIEASEKASKEEFDGRSTELEQVQETGKEEQQDLHERTDSTSGDMRKVEAAEGKVHGDGAKGELAKAIKAAQEDIKLLQNHLEQIGQALAESERLHQEHSSRASSGGRS